MQIVQVRHVSDDPAGPVGRDVFPLPHTAGSPPLFTLLAFATVFSTAEYIPVIGFNVASPYLPKNGAPGAAGVEF